MEPGWSRSQAERFSISLPPGWKAFDLSRGVGPLRNYVAEFDRSYAERLENDLKKALEASSFTWFAMDASSGRAPKGVDKAIISGSSGAPGSLRAAGDLVIGSLQASMRNVGRVQREQIELPVGPAIEFALDGTADDPDGKSVRLHVQGYILLDAGTGITASFQTTAPSAAKKETFRKMMESFRVP